MYWFDAPQLTTEYFCKWEGVIKLDQSFAQSEKLVQELSPFGDYIYVSPKSSGPPHIVLPVRHMGKSVLIGIICHPKHVFDQQMVTEQVTAALEAGCVHVIFAMPLAPITVFQSEGKKKLERRFGSKLTISRGRDENTGQFWLPYHWVTYDYGARTEIPKVSYWESVSSLSIRHRDLDLPADEDLELPPL